MFLAQALSADRSCQKAVDEVAIKRLAAGLVPGSTPLKATGDVDAALAKIQAHGVEYTIRKLERTGVTQVFFRDPDGVGVELNFAPAP